MQNKGISFYIKNYRFNSMFIRSFLLVFLLFFVPFAVIGGYYYFHTNSMLDNEIVIENAQQTKVVRAVADTFFKQANYICANIINADEVQMFMVNDWFNDIYGNRENVLSKFVATSPIIYENIDSIYIYSEFNDMVITSSGAARLAEHQDNSWYAWYRQIDDNKMIMVPRKRNDIFPQYISIIRPIYTYTNKSGAIVVNLNISKLFDLLGAGRYGTEENLFIANLDGLILSGSAPEHFALNITDIDTLKDITLNKRMNFNQTRVNNKNYINSMEYSENYNLVYITSTSMDKYSDKMNYIVTVIFLLIASLPILSIFVAYVVSTNTFKPIREIISVLEEPEKFNKFFDGVQTGNLNELKYIIKGILQTIQYNTVIQTELDNRLKMLDKSHFIMLQTQINPHFLYNTFETINWMAIGLSGEPDNAVSNALHKLGELFRISTKSSNYFISMSEEIKQSKLYIDILKLRYENMFDVIWDVSDKALERPVIKITLQPFIENALYHGIKPKGHGVIKIKADIVDEIFTLSIIDDGVGMSKENLDKLLETVNMDFKENDSHIGIYNVIRRYKIVFGDDCLLNISAKENDGCLIELSFPSVIL